MCLLFVETKVYGQETKNVHITGFIKNARSGAGVDSITITIMNADSSVVSSFPAFTTRVNGSRKISFFEADLSKKDASYIIMAEAPGFDAGYSMVDIVASKVGAEMELPDIILSKKKVINLGEVVVKATKIKMVMRGDTIVYPADAFNLEEGSMLRSLVRQLPGAELNENGEITVMGEHVDELTMNGKSFFKNNKNVMLDNLPCFTVKDIKVFHKTTEKSEFIGREVEPKIFTMDVQLKRQYNTGFIANAEVGAGTYEHYLGRLFGIRYTDCSRLSFYSNANNINEELLRGMDGSRNPSQLSDGRRKIFSAGLDVNVAQKRDKWKEEGNVEFSWTRNHLLKQTVSERFLSTDNVFNRSTSSSNDKHVGMNLKNGFHWKKGFKFDWDVDASYSRDKNDGLSHEAMTEIQMDSWGDVQQSIDAAFSAQLDPMLQKKLINRNSYNYLNDHTNSIFNNGLGLVYKLKWGDIIEFHNHVTYNNQKSNDFSRQQVEYFKQDGQDIGKNSHNHMPIHSYKYDLNADYRFCFTDYYTLNLEGTYKQDYTAKDKQFYNLELLPDWGVDGDKPFGELPSNRNELLMALNTQNSFQSNEMNKEFLFNIDNAWYRYEHSTGNIFTMHISLNSRFHNQRLDYRGVGVPQFVSKKNWYLEPRYYLYVQKNRLGMGVNYSLQMISASLDDMVEKRNDENPLSVSIGNPDLKSMIIHQLWYNCEYKWGRNNKNSLWVNYDQFQRSFAQECHFNGQTGGYTFRPVNVNGNNTFSVIDNINMRLYKDFIYLTAGASYWLINNADLSTVGDQENVLNKVKTHQYRSNLTLSFKKEKVSIDAIGNVTYRHSTSTADAFIPIDYINFSYGLRAICQIPFLNASISTDMKMYSRRGFAVESLNSNDLIWNASLSKSFVKGKLVVKLEAVDILQQLRNTDIVVTGQGRTETISNTLPRYAMLRLQWNFTKTQK